MSDANRRLVREAESLVFVCSGNAVRSAFAELVARRLGCPKPVHSVATVFRNDRMFPETVRALHRFGVPPDWIEDFRPMHVEDWMEREAARPLYLGMTRGHLDALEAWPAARARARLLDDPREIADPVLDDVTFVATFERVETCVRRILAELDSTPSAG